MSKQGTPARTAGRPVGSVQTPRKVLEQDMREAARLNKRIRELVSKQVDAVETELAKGDASLEKRLKAIEMLSSAMNVQTAGIDKTAKHLLAEPNEGETPLGGTAAADRDADDVLREITGVRGG